MLRKWRRKYILNGQAPARVKKVNTIWVGTCFACGASTGGRNQQVVFDRTFCHVRDHHTYTLEG